MGDQTPAGGKDPIDSLRQEFKKSSDRQRTRSRLKKAFDLAVSAALGGGGLYYGPGLIDSAFRDIDTLRLNAIETVIEAPVNTSCLRAATLKPPGHKDGDSYEPTQKQLLLASLFNRMNESEVGRHLNQSATKNDLIWCVDDIETGNYGYYKSAFNLAAISSRGFGPVQNLLSNKTAHDLALRTAYEENAHAWQKNEHDAQSYSSILTGPLHAMVYDLAIEADARVITVAALDQHRQQGDKTLWQRNLADRKNTAMMAAFDNALAENRGPDAYPKALRSVFDVFYSADGNSYAYQYNINPSMQWGQRKLSSEYFEKRFGFVPGQRQNYLKQTGFNPDDERYHQIHNDDLLYHMTLKYIENGQDPLTLKSVRDVGFGQFKSVRLSERDSLHVLQGQNERDGWVSIQARSVEQNGKSPYYIDADALEKGWLVISTRYSEDLQRLIHIQKLSDLKGKIQDLRPAETVSDYSSSNDRYVEYKDLSRIKALQPSWLERLKTSIPQFGQ